MKQFSALFLFVFAAPHFKPILEIALITGMRQGKILKMKWKDIDFRLLMIRTPAENSKTKQEQFISIDSNLIEALDSIERKGEYVFMNGWTEDRQKGVDEAFWAACEQAGIPSGRKAGLVFHDLRHLAAYRLVKVRDVVIAARILDHSSILTTQRYFQPTEKDKRAAVERAAENLFRGRQKDVNTQKLAVEKIAENRTLFN